MEFRDLKRQYKNIKKEVDEQINSVIESSHFISGSQVKELELELAEYVGRKHCITCANGTDAISIALMAAGIGEQGGGSKEDVVFVPDFTFFSSGECPATVGATPVFVDVYKNTYNMDVQKLECAVEKVISEGKYTPKAVIAVDLFGQPFEYEAVRALCDKYDMLLLEDAAQGFGGEYTLNDGRKKRAGSLGNISTTSFFPAKPLGCYGDGGAIFTDDDKLATLCRSIAVHGKDMEHPDDPNAKYNNIRLGMNSRLDTIQAGILLAKLKVFKETELIAVNHVAERYTKNLSDIPGVILPIIGDKFYSSWAQFTLQLPAGTKRSEIQKTLKAEGIPTNIYYIKPMHKQGAFVGTRSSEADCTVTEELCDSVLCLPIHPYLKDDEIDFVCQKFKEAIK
ncbi:MAG: DegT/DnrJ/EryC1/StrS aminotransferase family protein [Butyrivibrio sp.]|nr:DegT/DnrJ/EryC1/StrS aminotransferase family protein [Butyrivibrio sp.]